MKSNTECWLCRGTGKMDGGYGSKPGSECPRCWGTGKELTEDEIEIKKLEAAFDERDRDWMTEEEARDVGTE